MLHVCLKDAGLCRSYLFFFNIKKYSGVNMFSNPKKKKFNHVDVEVVQCDIINFICSKTI